MKLEAKLKHDFEVVEFPVFADYCVHIEVTNDLRRAMDLYPATKVVPLEPGVGAITVHKVEENFSFIFLQYKSSVGDIAHECWHAVNRMLKSLGVELDSETVAYHLGYLVNRTCKLIHESRVKNRKSMQSSPETSEK